MQQYWEHYWYAGPRFLYAWFESKPVNGDGKTFFEILYHVPCPDFTLPQYQPPLMPQAGYRS